MDRDGEEEFQALAAAEPTANNTGASVPQAPHHLRGPVDCGSRTWPPSAPMTASLQATTSPCGAAARGCSPRHRHLHAPNAWSTPAALAASRSTLETARVELISSFNCQQHRSQQHRSVRKNRRGHHSTRRTHRAKITLSKTQLSTGEAPDGIVVLSNADTRPAKLASLVNRNNVLKLTLTRPTAPQKPGILTRSRTPRATTFMNGNKDLITLQPGMSTNKEVSIAAVVWQPQRTRRVFAHRHVQVGHRVPRAEAPRSSSRSRPRRSRPWFGPMTAAVWPPNLATCSGPRSPRMRERAS